MIRSIITLSFALFALSAQAMPKVGDYAKFDATITMGDQNVAGSLTFELVQQDSAGRYLQRQTVEFPGRNPEVQEDWKEATDLTDDATVDQILNNCSAFGGAKQSVTVPAGTFDSCALPFDDENAKGMAYVAKVPFGFVRQDATQKESGQVVQIQLREFR